MNEFKHIKTGDDLYSFMTRLLANYSDRIDSIELADYLISLWAVSGEYADKTEFWYSDIAYMLQKAFALKTVEVDWEEEISKPYDDELKAVPNTPEYYREIETYDYFCRYIKNMIVDLLRRKQNLPMYMHWENCHLANFLERASTSIEAVAEEYGLECNWGDVSMFLHEGQYVE
jgi:hypothetical protein